MSVQWQKMTIAPCCLTTFKSVGLTYQIQFPKPAGKALGTRCVTPSFTSPLSTTGCFCQYSTEISSFHCIKRIALLVGDGGNILPQFLPLPSPYYEQKCVTSEYISLNVKIVLFLSWHGGLNFVGGQVLKSSHED